MRRTPPRTAVRSCHQGSRGVTAAIPAGWPSVGRAAPLSGWDDIVDPVVGMETPLPTALGDKTARPLARQLELHTVGDLLRHYPRRYIAHTQVTHSSDREDQRFRDKEHVTLLGTVHSVTGRRMRQPQGPHHRGDGGDRRPAPHLHLLQPALPRARPAARHARPVLRRPQPLQGRLAARRPRVHRARRRCQRRPAGAHPDLPGHQEAALLGGDDGRAPGARPPRRPRGPAARGAARRPRARDARRRPAQRSTCPTPGRAEGGPARASMWDEAFVLQLALARRRPAPPPATARVAPARGPGRPADARSTPACPFALTGGQRAVGEEIAEDLAATTRCNRLLQGEVGSGKTIVALRAMLAGRRRRRPGRAARARPRCSPRSTPGRCARCSGRSAGRASSAAPTDATKVTLLTGSMGAAARARRCSTSPSGEAGIVVGTHALIQENVQLRRPRPGRRRRAAPLRGRTARRPARPRAPARRTCW